MLSMILKAPVKTGLEFRPTYGCLINSIFPPVFLLVIALIWMSVATAIEDAAFLAEVNRVGEIYKRVEESPETIHLLKIGRKSEVNKHLQDLVPSNNKTVYDYFIVANMLYRADPRVSDEYIKIAASLSPNNPFILYEQAIHEHRSGNCQSALPLYKRAAHLLKRTPAVLWAYVTHCELVVGHYKDAVDAWKKVDFREHHTEIEKGMYEIFSTYDPDMERERLVNSILAGRTDGVCRLVKLDKNWESDWWNVIEKSDFLAEDTALLKAKSLENQKMKSVVSMCLEASNLSDALFLKYVNAQGFWGDHAKLPEDTSATYTLISQLIQRKIATPKEILEHFESQLQQRHLGMPKDQPTLDLLAYLYSQTQQSDRLKQLDLYGWKTLNLETYAESFIQQTAPTTMEYQNLVAAAAQDFPNSVAFQVANLHSHQKDKDRKIFLMRFVAAQFANVKNHLVATYRLNDYMASLVFEVDSK